MSEKINEIKIQEATPSEPKKGDDFEIEKTPELITLSDEIGVVKEAVDHDKPINFNQLESVEKLMDGLMVDIGGDKISIGELKNIPDFKMNAEIWREIENGDFGKIFQLTYITTAIAELLSKKQKGHLILSRLTSISNETAEALAKYKGDLYLSRLTSISDETAEALSKHKGNLFLDRLESLSDKAAESLAKHYPVLFPPKETEGADKYYPVHLPSELNVKLRKFQKFQNQQNKI